MEQIWENKSEVTIVCIEASEIKLKSNEKSCKNHEVCNDIMPTEKNKRLAFTQYLKFIRVPFLICADLEALIKKY